MAGMEKNYGLVDLRICRAKATDEEKGGLVDFRMFRRPCRNTYRNTHRLGSTAQISYRLAKYRELEGDRHALVRTIRNNTPIF